MVRWHLRDRTFFFLAVLTTALAVGANLVVFTIVDALWLRPASVHDRDRVVVAVRDLTSPDPSRFTDLGLTLLRANSEFEAVAGQVVTRGLFAGVMPAITIEGTSGAVEALAVTPEYFSVLGVQIRGRDFSYQDDQPGAVAVAIISDRLWRSRFARGDVLGRIVPAFPQPLEIVGIAPPSFQGALLGEHVDLWLPHKLLPQLAGISAQRAAEVRLSMIALCRLREGATIATAQDWFARSPRGGRQLVALRSLFGAPDIPMVVIAEGSLFTVAAVTAFLVLVSGCATLMALVLVHYERRRREMSIRLALGAGRGRLIRELATELARVTVCGGAAAVCTASLLLGALPRFQLPNGIDSSRVNLALDWRVIGAGLAASAIAMAIGAALPLRLATTADVALSLITPHATAARSSVRLRGAILALQVAATVVVLLAAGLFVRSVLFGFRHGPGFDADRTLFMEVTGGGWYSRFESEPSRTTRVAILQQLFEGIERMPGVDAVAFGTAPLGPQPLLMLSPREPIVAESGSLDPPFAWVQVGVRYLDALHAPLLIGRSGDHGELVVTASLAESLWPGESPLGRVLRHGPFSGTVVGVTDLAFGSMKLGRPAVVFDVQSAERLAKSSGGSTSVQLTVRSNNAAALLEPLRRMVREALPAAPVLTVTSGTEVVAADLGRQRLGAWFFSGFGIVSMMLGMGSVFGLVAYLLEARRREFGVMLALGATHRHLTRSAVQTGLAPTALGAAGGAGAAMLFARTVESLLIGIRGFDLRTYAGTLIAFLVCATAACLIGAWRVRRIAPMDALRAE